VPDNPRIDDLRKRLDREPGSRVFAQLAEELRKAGQLPEAIRVARQGLLVHPTYPSARMTLGRALLDLRDLRGARAEFEAVLRGAADNILASRFLGECLEGLGDLGSALLQYRATLRLAPGDKNLEAQIRALEQKLTPAAASPAAAQPLAPALRPPALPRAGAIPVLEVDGPMELETSFDKTVAWRPPVATVAPVPQVEPPPQEQPAHADLAGAGEEKGDGSPVVAMEEPAAIDALLPDATNLPPEFEPIDSEPPPAIQEPALAPGPANLGFPDTWAPHEGAAEAVAELAEASASAESSALSSSTLAELYFNQGFTRQAIDVYKELLEREPGNGRIAARIAELEAIERDLEGGLPIAAVAPSEPKASRRAAVERTITRLEEFLAAVRRA
jgi:tetratricopeptide (TPR) repeat protein